MGHGGAAGESLSWGGLEALHLPSGRAGARGQRTGVQAHGRHPGEAMSSQPPCCPKPRRFCVCLFPYFCSSVCASLCLPLSCPVPSLLPLPSPPSSVLREGSGAAPVRDRVPRMEGGFSREVLGLGLGSQNDRVQLPTFFAKHPHQALPVLGVLGARAGLSLPGRGGRGAHPQNCSVGS